eukprot:TRINITY_DN11636_c0_g1_i1.p1 TRINITY_DN11636_c0_g1~~TRINITY_DN11636_c0_g1_i1.p1  ORF type:complete len:470 (+),score=85.48 TRINITY_DN11636_c0_g1_i1:193-1410(+)
MAGLKYKLKSKSSLTRKVKGEIDEEMVCFKIDEDDKPDPVEIVWKRMRDALRYTIISPTENYCATVQLALDTLKEKGYPPFMLKNYWVGGDGYQGINDDFSIPCEDSPFGSFAFEVQFHTPESYWMKGEGTHQIYEKMRVAEDPDVITALFKDQADLVSTVPVPEGVLKFEKLMSTPLPGESHMYAKLFVHRALELEGDVTAALKKIVEQVAGCSVKGTEVQPVSETEKRLDKMVLYDGHSIDDDDDNDSPELKDACNRMYDILTVALEVASDQDFKKAVAAIVSGLAATADGKGGIPLTLAGIYNGFQKPNKSKSSQASCGFSLGFVLHLTCPGKDDGVAWTDDTAVPFAVAVHTPESLAAQEELAKTLSDENLTAAEKKATLSKIRNGVRAPQGAEDDFGVKV